MIRCSKCKVIYRENTPDKCSLCKQDLTKEKKQEFKKEVNKKDLYKWIKKNEENIKIREEKIKQEQLEQILEKRKIKFAKLKCRICNSHNINVILNDKVSNVFIKCNDCKNVDTREYYNDNTEKFGKLIKCDLCGTTMTSDLDGRITSTDINEDTGLLNWDYTDFQHLKNIVLCRKCAYEHIDELEEKDEKIANKHLTIEYMFDDEDLKYWKEGDIWDYDDTITCDLENFGYKKAYKKALKEMKSKFPKTTKFIDNDEC